MGLSLKHNGTSDRHWAMLQSAFCEVIRNALADHTTIEIMANADGSIWVERVGVGVERFSETLTAGDRDRIIRLIAATTSETGSTSSIVTAELPGNGERFEGILPPISSAPCFSIRKLARTPFSLDDLVTQGALSPQTCEALRKALADQRNLVIAGGTSSGKTSFANALLAEPALQSDRLVILEDTVELTCSADNHVQLRTQTQTVSLQDLVRSTLRLRPDRIVVGEVRGGEALDFLKAWNTGHGGGLTTIHANSALSALHRLEQLSTEILPHPPFELIAEAVDVVVFLTRENGVRRVREAIRVTGFDGEHYRTEPLVTPSLTLVSKGAV